MPYIGRCSTTLTRVAWSHHLVVGYFLSNRQTGPRAGMRWELLDRFLRDACDEAERAEILRWAAESPRHRQVLDELVEALRAADNLPSILIEWQRLRREFEIEAESDEEKPDPP